MFVLVALGLAALIVIDVALVTLLFERMVYEQIQKQMPPTRLSNVIVKYL
jgi:hypothetical protein